MGKKRIATKKGGSASAGLKARALSKASKRKIDAGILHVQSTYNNTRVSLTDSKGNLAFSSSCGALGFRGAKKGTPFAAAKVGEIVGEQAKTIGVKDVSIVVKGVGSGRESAIRAFVSKGISISAIFDRTPIPHNGTRRRRARRV